MKLEGKNILLISPEKWNHIFVSKHHYAVHLAERGNLVFFLNPPSSHDSVARTHFTNVLSVHYSGFPKGLRFYPSILQRYFIKDRFAALQTLCNVEFDVIWSFDNSVFFDFRPLPKKVLRISHIVDFSQNFETSKAARSADICFCTSESIKDRLLRYNKNVFRISHGFAFSQSRAKVILPGEQKIKAIYAGNLAISYIDWRLFLQCVNDNLHVDFILIGPGGQTVCNEFMLELKNKTNVFFTGQVDADELPNYYSRADILLLCYEQKYQAEQVTNPHKMMEYLGSGKMIIATHTNEYLALAQRHFFLMSNNNIEFPSLLKKALQELKIWNSAEKQRARKAFALENTYKKQIERIEEHIANP